MVTLTTWQRCGLLNVARTALLYLNVRTHTDVYVIRCLIHLNYIKVVITFAILYTLRWPVKVKPHLIYLCTIASLLRRRHCSFDYLVKYIHGLEPAFTLGSHPGRQSTGRGLWCPGLMQFRVQAPVGEKCACSWGTPQLLTGSACWRAVQPASSGDIRSDRARGMLVSATFNVGNRKETLIWAQLHLIY